MISLALGNDRLLRYVLEHILSRIKIIAVFRIIFMKDIHMYAFSHIPKQP